MTMRVTDQGSKELSKSLAVTTGQVEDRKDFLQASFGTLVPYEKQWYDFWFICRQKDSVKQKELEKAIEDARKEESAKDNQKGAKPKASPRGK